ncbi:hypothetical protein P3T23_004424 [Paraburkholderia sp. GAS448]|uniref:DUF4148 domain-containing protein n=1 Tax=Paraburkholderia sp. GAS448 TaxID=3035136 RepID=UPI003D1C60C4
MIKRIVIVSLMFCAAVGIATSAPAQEKTREQVRQELIEAESNGLNSVTDASSTDVAPISEEQAAGLKQQNDDSGTGAEMTGRSDAGHIKRKTSPSAPPACVGPVSFCDIFFGGS